MDLYYQLLTKSTGDASREFSHFVAVSLNCAQYCDRPALAAVLLRGEVEVHRTASDDRQVTRYILLPAAATQLQRVLL